MGSSLITGLGRASVVALDTNVFVYALEDNPDFPDAADLFRVLAPTSCRLVTSTLTILEATVPLFRAGEAHRIPNYLEFIHGEGRIEVIALADDIALRAAKLRADWRRLATPDAIQLATANYAGATAFVTADRDLARVKLEDLRIVRLAAR